MKRIYQVWFDGDLGELWLDENLQPLEYLAYDDGDINHNHDFIFDCLGVKKIRIEIFPTEKEVEKFCDMSLDKNEVFKLFKKKIKEQL